MNHSQPRGYALFDFFLSRSLIMRVTIIWWPGCFTPNKSNWCSRKAAAPVLRFYFRLQLFVEQSVWKLQSFSTSPWKEGRYFRLIAQPTRLTQPTVIILLKNLRWGTEPKGWSNGNSQLLCSPSTGEGKDSQFIFQGVCAVWIVQSSIVNPASSLWGPTISTRSTVLRLVICNGEANNQLHM